MSDIKPSDNQDDQNKTWGDRLKSSLQVGLILTGAWMVIVVVAGGQNPRGAAGMSSLLGNAFGIFVVVSVIAFIVKSIRNAE